MKKYLFIGLIALCAGCLTACNDKDPVQKINIQTLDLTVLHNDWKFDDKALQYYYHFNLPEIDTHVYNYGNWTISREYNKGYNDAYQVALPMSLYMTDTLTNGNVVYYTQHIDYRVGVGYVEVQLTNSDYFYGQDNPEDMFFRMQIMD